MQPLVLHGGLLLALPLCLTLDFDWTKDHGGSFYYGTFPAGKYIEGPK